MIPEAFQVYLPFFGASVLLALAPGPDILLALSLSFVHGPRKGAWLTAGLLSGIAFHTLAAALGLAAVLKASPRILSAIIAVGALYLIYIAAQTIRGAFAARRQPDAPGAALPKQLRLDSAALYRRGLFMNATNPKVALFFLAYLPGFIRPAWPLPPFVQFLLLGLTFVAGAACGFLPVVLAAGSLGSVLNRSPRVRFAISLAAGLLIAAIAIWLLLGLPRAARSSQPGHSSAAAARYFPEPGRTSQMRTPPFLAVMRTPPFTATNE